MSIKLLENDGHNTPMFHLFKNWKQVRDIIRLDDDELEELKCDGFTDDGNGVLWEVFKADEQLHVVNHIDE